MKSLARLVIPAVCGLLGGAIPAAADVTYFFQVSNTISPGQAECMVDLWAEFDPGDFAIAGVEFDVLAALDPGGFAFTNNLIKGPGTRLGKIALNADSVTNVIAGQIPHLDPEVRFDNPIHVWRGKWSTTDFTPRIIPLRTATHNFEVYIDETYESVSVQSVLIEGDGVIYVGCYADCDGSGELDLFDFLCFTNDFNLGVESADCDGSGDLDLFDFLCFMNAFSEGC